MKKLTTLGLLAGCASVFLTFAATAPATVLYTQTGAFPTTGTSTQTGRLVRNGVGQDFSGTEAYPGTNNPTVNFNYITITLSPAQLGNGPYVQIELDSQGLNLFASAYVNSYNPLSPTNPSGNFATNWLGDEGSSGDYSFGNTPNGTPDISFFGVTVPAGQSLVVVLATAGAGGTGAGTSYGLRIENFSTRDYTDAVSVPEPSSLAAMGLVGLAGLGLAARRRFAKA